MEWRRMMEFGAKIAKKALNFHKGPLKEETGDETATAETDKTQQQMLNVLFPNAGRNQTIVLVWVWLHRCDAAVWQNL